VGISPDGKVVFGFCLQCLADTNCRLVDVPARGPYDFILGFSTSKAIRPVTGHLAISASQIDQSRWIIGVVAFLMITWGLVVLAAGLAMPPSPDPQASPFGNGTTALLGIGGGVTSLLGLGLLVLVAYRDEFPGLVLLTLVSWLSFLAAIGMLLYGIADYQPRRNVLLVLGVCTSVLISVVSRLLERSQRRALKSIGSFPMPKPASAPDKSNADGPGRLL
jgi:hypothetical protein